MTVNSKKTRQSGCGEGASVTVIIVNYNSGYRLEKCLKKLQRQTVSDFELIVFDNNSQDSSLNAVEQVFGAARVIRSETNIGFAAANNAAAREASGEWIALLNPDAYPESDWLERLLSAAHQFSDVDAFGSLQLDAEKASIVDGAGDVCSVYGIAYRGGYGGDRHGALGKEVAVVGECFAPCAAAALYSREKFLELGGFDERFFCYGEDVDFGFRLRNAGGRSVQVNDAIVHHEGSGVSGRYSEFTMFHGHRNRIWLYYKNMPMALYIMTMPLRLFADVLLLIRSVANGTASSYVRALIAGYGGLHRLNESRAAIVAHRRESGARIGSALCWSPVKTLRRSIDLRPVEALAPMAEE